MTRDIPKLVFIVTERVWFPIFSVQYSEVCRSDGRSCIWHMHMHLVEVAETGLEPPFRYSGTGKRRYSRNSTPICTLGAQPQPEIRQVFAVSTVLAEI